MTPDLEGLIDYASVTLLIGGLLGKLLGASSKDDDLEVVQCHDVVIEALSDADRTAVTEAITDRNWRDQLTVEQAEALHEERELRKMGKRRN